MTPAELDAGLRDWGERIALDVTARITEHMDGTASKLSEDEWEAASAAAYAGAAGLLLDRWPYVLLVATMLALILAGPRLTRWWPAYERRRDRPRPSIDQASHDRGDKT